MATLVLSCFRSKLLFTKAYSYKTDEMTLTSKHNLFAQICGSLKTILLCIVGGLAEGGSLAVAVGISDI